MAVNVTEKDKTLNEIIDWCEQLAAEGLRLSSAKATEPTSYTHSNSKRKYNQRSIWRSSTNDRRTIIVQPVHPRHPRQ